MRCHGLASGAWHGADSYHGSLLLDNLTHALVGAAISKAGAERATPLATATLVIAANAPDIDILSYVNGPYFALSFRRGITHGWPALILLPLIVTAGVLAWDRWVRRRRDPQADPVRPRAILALSALGLLTHPTLDWMNTYGMRWGLPFDGGWSYGDALFIVDPWLWLALGGAVFLSGGRGARRSSAWGALAVAASALVLLAGGPAAGAVWAAGLCAIVVLSRRPSRPGPRWVLGVLAVAATYVAVLLAADTIARADVRAAGAAAGLVVEDVMVAPLPANPFRSEVEVRTPDAFVPGAHEWLGRPRATLEPQAAVALLRGPAGVSEARLLTVAEAARSDADVAAYLVWSRYPYVRISTEGEGWRVRFLDARYDARPEAGSLGSVSTWVPDAETR